jgi:cytochrome c
MKLTSKLITASLAVALTSTLAVASFDGDKDALDGGMIYPRDDGVETAYRYNEQAMKKLNYGRVPTKNELKAWDRDIMPDGTGLPDGQGSVEEGDELYEAQCASCHGEFGAGGKGYPTLAGGSVKSLSNQRTCPGKDAPKRTIGSYWPQVSTLIWYIRDAMPYSHPKSFTNDELYAMTAYLLSANEITIDGKEMDDEFVLNKKNIMKIKLPNRDGFYPKIDGPDGIENVRDFFKDPKNFGAVGVRCMSDCGKEKVMRIGMEITDVVPAYSTMRDLPKEKAGGAKSKAEKMYDSSCSVCHKTDAMGAPALGDKDAWASVIKQGLKTINKHAIKGLGGMPPKGGNSDLTDAQVKDIVKFMVESSK